MSDLYNLLVHGACCTTYPDPDSDPYTRNRAVIYLISTLDGELPNGEVKYCTVHAVRFCVSFLPRYRASSREGSKVRTFVAAQY